MTVGEIGEALKASRDADEAANLISQSVEASTKGDVDGAIARVQTEYTMGERVRAAAQAWRDVLAEELKCAEVNVGEGTVEITYGVRTKGENGEPCAHRFEGQHNIKVERVPDAGQVEVSHEWVNLSNQKVTASGNAKVTWDLFQLSRHIDHDLTWSRNGAEAEGTWRATGERTQTLLEASLFKGIKIDGTRTWSHSEREGAWELDIDRVEVEWGLPAPRSGTYTLTAPNDKFVSMGFEQVDDSTVRVTLETGKRKFQVDITLLGVPKGAIVEM